MEQEIIRRRADDQRRFPLPQQIDPRFIERQPMDEDGVRAQNAEPIQLSKLLLCLGVDSFTSMQDKGSVGWCSFVGRAEIASQGKRVTPPILPRHSDGKVISPQLRPERIMMTYRSHAAQKIAKPAPPQPRALRNRVMGRDDVRKLAMNVLSPFHVISVRRISEPWIQSELQMIVRVYQSRQNHVSGQIDVDG